MSAKPEVPYGRGPALEALGVFYALSCYLSLIFKHSDTIWDLTKLKIVDQFFFGGGAPIAPPLNPPMSKKELPVTVSMSI